MTLLHLKKRAKLIGAGAFIMQVPGCAGNFVGDVLGAVFAPQTLEFVQTVFLGITAAGAVAIIENI